MTYNPFFWGGAAWPSGLEHQFSRSHAAKGGRIESGRFQFLFLFLYILHAELSQVLSREERKQMMRGSTPASEPAPAPSSLHTSVEETGLLEECKKESRRWMRFRRRKRERQYNRRFALCENGD